MWDDGNLGGQVVVAVRQSCSDRWSDRLGGLSYRWSGIGGWSDRQVYRLDEQSDDVGQPDEWIVGLMGGVTDGHVIDELMGW